jgi:hypothetical protein
MLLPRHPLVRRRCTTCRSAAFLRRPVAVRRLHPPPAQRLARTFTGLLELLDAGPVYLSCYRGTADLEPYEDPVLGEVYVSEATEAEVEALLPLARPADLTVEVRPDPILDRRRPWVVALGTLVR